jgi:hypothetical protein
MSSPRENLIAYLAELQPFFNLPVETNGLITLNLKKEIMASFESYRAYKSFLDSSKLKLFADKFPGGGCIIKSSLDSIYIDVAAFINSQPKSVSSKKSTFQPGNQSNDRPKDTDFHVTRLKGYFQVSKADISESIKFLLSEGWTERQFNKVGISRATYHRYKVDRVKFKRNTRQSRKEKPKQ